MQTEKERTLRMVEAAVQQEAECLAGDFARAASAEREEVLAALEFERWLVQSCQAVRVRHWVGSLGTSGSGQTGKVRRLGPAPAVYLYW